MSRRVHLDDYSADHSALRHPEGEADDQARGVESYPVDCRLQCR